MLGFSSISAAPLAAGPPPTADEVSGSCVWVEAADVVALGLSVVVLPATASASWAEQPDVVQVAALVSGLQLQAGWVEAPDVFATQGIFEASEYVRAPAAGASWTLAGNIAPRAVRLMGEPEAMAVSIDDARIHAKCNGTDRDSEIEIEVRGITAEAEHHTGRVIIDRTYQVTFDRFPAVIELPRAPLRSVASIKFFDPDGVEQKLYAGDYIVDDMSVRGSIRPGAGLAWPETQDRINAVTVTITCGYGPDHTTTPPAFKRYILARLKEIFGPAGTPESPYLIRTLDSLVIY